MTQNRVVSLAPDGGLTVEFTDKKGVVRQRAVELTVTRQGLLKIAKADTSASVDQDGDDMVDLSSFAQGLDQAD